MANKEAKLQIVIDAQNRTQGTFNALKSNLDAVGKSYDGLRSTMTAVGAAGAAAFGGLAFLTKGIIEAGVGFEQTQIAFETMIGSGERAKTLLEELSRFAAQTPFEMTQLEEASKRLLAYGISVEELIPTLTLLGDITAGVGMDKLPQLILAFGQVKAATKLTGMELRQFTEAGVPMLDALVQHFNKTGKAMTTVTNAAGLTSKEVAKLTKTNEAAQDKLHALNLTLQKQENRMRDMVKNNKDSGASYQNLAIDIAETKRKIEEQTAAVAMNNDTLARAGQTITLVGEAAKLTAGDIQEMVSDGAVTFADVQAALQSLTAEGGRFHDLMIRQSTTLGGLWSNLKDQIHLTAREIGEQLLPYLKPMAIHLIEIVTAVRDFVAEHPKLSAILLVALLGFTGLLALLLPLALALPGLILMFQGLAAAISFTAAAIMAINLPIVGLLALLGVLGFTAIKIGAQWQDVWSLMSIAVGETANVVVVIVEALVNFIINAVNALIGQINRLLSAMAALPIVGKQFKKMSLPTLDTVSWDGIDTGAMYNEMMARPNPANRTGDTVLQIFGNNLFDEDSAERIGDLLMQRLKMSNPI